MKTELQKNFLGNLEARFLTAKIRKIFKRMSFCWLKPLYDYPRYSEWGCVSCFQDSLFSFVQLCGEGISVNAEIFWVRLTVTVLRLVKFYWNICKIASKFCLLCFDAVNDIHSGMSVINFLSYLIYTLNILKLLVVVFTNTLQNTVIAITFL
jgi:hypothetical protein